MSDREPSNPAPSAYGPPLGVLIGALVLFLMPRGIGWPLRILAAFAVVALVTYLSVVLPRRRR
jgi:hypothetical protein